MIYVDSLVNWGWKLRGHIVKSCHMFSDEGIEELNEMAINIGMKIEWLQKETSSKVGVAHYDLVESKRKKAIELGAKEVPFKEAVKIWKEIKSKGSQHLKNS